MIKTGLLLFLKIFISLFVLKCFEFGFCVFRNIFTPTFYSSLTRYYAQIVCTNIVKYIGEDFELKNINLLAETFLVCTYNLHYIVFLIALIHLLCTNIVKYVRNLIFFLPLRSLKNCLFLLEHARTCNAKVISSHCIQL